MYRTLPVARCPTPLKEAPTPTKYSNAKRVLSLSLSYHKKTRRPTLFSFWFQCSFEFCFTALSLSYSIETTVREKIKGMRGDSTDSIEGGSLTLEDLKQKMAEFAKERDWDRFHSPRNLLLALVETKPRNPSVYLLLFSFFFHIWFFFQCPCPFSFKRT